MRASACMPWRETFSAQHGSSAPGIAGAASMLGCAKAPPALASATMLKMWSDKDRTLGDGCRRTAQQIVPVRLYGPCTPGTGHDHIYQLGRANHGNRSRAG